MALDGTATFPTSVWDGDSGNRDSDGNNKKDPDYRDWERMVSEVSAAQTRVNANAAGTDDDAIDSSGTVTTKTGLSVVEKGNGAIHKSVLTLASVAMAATDGSVPATDGNWGAQSLYTFPEGQIVILGAHMVFPLGSIVATTGGGTGLSDTADIGMGVGSVSAANSTEFGLSGTEEDIIAENNGVDLVAAASDAIESGINAALVPLDGSAAAVEAFLNFRTLDDADAGTVADILTVSGTITLVWTVIGND